MSEDLSEVTFTVSIRFVEIHSVYGPICSGKIRSVGLEEEVDKGYLCSDFVFTGPIVD